MKKLNILVFVSHPLERDLTQVGLSKEHTLTIVGTLDALKWTLTPDRAFDVLFVSTLVTTGMWSQILINLMDSAKIKRLVLIGESKPDPLASVLFRDLHAQCLSSSRRDPLVMSLDVVYINAVQSAGADIWRNALSLFRFD